MKNNYVLGIPPSGSWQDLKDHMREAGDVCYADVFRDGTGVVEFGSKDDAEYAMKHLDDSKFRSHEVMLIIYFEKNIKGVVFLYSGSTLSCS